MIKRKSNGIFYVVISLIAVFAIAGGVAAYAISQNVNVAGDYIYNEAENQPNPINEGEIELGGSSPNKYFRHNFHVGYQSGGDRYATTSLVSTYTLVAAEFNGNKTYIDWTAGLNITLTTMATTSMGSINIPRIGDERSYWFRSATTTDATTITFAAGTGVDIQHGDSTGDDLVIDGLDLAKLTFIRKNNTDVLLIIKKFTEGD